MKKLVKLFTLFLIPFFHTSCGQNQTNSPKDNIKSETKDTVTSYGPNNMVRNVKQDRNGNILIAASWGGVFRYDGKSFTNLTSSKIGSRRFWDVLEDRKGNLWLTAWDFSTRPSKPGVYRYNGLEGLQHFTTKEGLANDTVNSIYEDKAGNIWFGTNGGISRYDGKYFRNFTTKDNLINNDIPIRLELIFTKK
jgi:ligand-binding sensor domain-containing protein